MLSLDLGLVASLPLVEVAQHFKGTANLFQFAQFFGVWFIQMVRWLAFISCLVLPVVRSKKIINGLLEKIG
jgi:hypothetical protein